VMFERPVVVVFGKPVVVGLKQAVAVVQWCFAVVGLGWAFVVVVVELGRAAVRLLVVGLPAVGRVVARLLVGLPAGGLVVGAVAVHRKLLEVFFPEGV